MTSSTTSTLMVEALYQNFGQLIDSAWPLWYLIFGVGLFLFGITIFTRAFIRGLKKISK